MALGKVNHILKVSKTTTTQDENGNPIPTTTEWQTKAEYKPISTKSLLYAGQPTDLEVIEVKYRYHKDRKIDQKCVVEFMGKQWNPEGESTPDYPQRPRYWIQILKHG